MIAKKIHLTEIRKRDGRIVPFEQGRITRAISRAMQASGEGDPSKDAERVSEQVVSVLNKKYPAGTIPNIENIQDVVETQLILMDFAKTAKAYIIYRSERAKIREQRHEIPEPIKKLAAESKKYFKNPLAEFIYYRTYSRWIEEENRRETWIETIDRYINFMRENLGKKLSDEEYTEIRDSILNQKVMPSMRLLWSAGRAARTTNVAAFNCSYIAPSKIEDFAEIAYILMCGTGVGFSVESQTAQQLPQIKKKNNGKTPKVHDYVIEDFKEGWADALTFGMKAWFKGEDVKFDFSKVRPAGTRLKTMGGRSSGPEPLRSLLNFTREKILSRAGKRLRNIDVHDIICKIGEVVVMGGVRRSALLSLSDLDDPEMRDAKKGPFYVKEPQRSLANNSAVYNEKPTAKEFMKEWVALAESGSGERGVFNRGGLKHQLPERRWKVFEEDSETAGTNPCAEIILKSREFCVKGDTYLLTRDGITTIEEAEGKEIEIWNGKEWSRVTPRRTGRNQKMVRVILSDGSYLDCTPDHRFSVKHRFQNEWREVQAKNLLHSSKYAVEVEPTKVTHTEGIEYTEAYDLGVVTGDGYIYNGRVFVDLYGAKDLMIPLQGAQHKEYLPKGYSVTKVRVRTSLNSLLVEGLRNNVKAFRALFTWNRESILKFIAGLIDADGSETSTGGVRLYLSNYERACMVQLLLTKCGIPSSANLMQPKDAKTNLGTRKRDVYYVQIADCSDIPCKRVNISRGHTPWFKEKYQMIRDVVTLEGEHDSFCFKEKREHKAIFNNVLTYQCNLSEVVCRAEDTEETLIEKARIAAILGTYQATLTNYPYLSKEWRKNCEEEALLGVSITGQWDSPAVRNPKTLEKMKEKAIETNKEYAKKFGINQSTCITCVKPSGNVSQLTDASSGCHTRHSKYYIRRVRIAATDSLFQMLKDQKVPYYPEVGQTPANASTYVFEFPVKAPEGAACRNDLTAIEQLRHWKMVKENFTEHNPSVTISIGEGEWIGVANWLYENWDILGGLAFLPKSDYVYLLAPYEEITEEKYNEMVQKFPNVDFAQIVAYEKDDETQGAKELACVSGTCDIDDTIKTPAETAIEASAK